MKRKIINVLFALLFLVGFGILAYPTISNQWNTYRQSKLISNYQAMTEAYEEEDFTREWEKAKRYNDKITVNAPKTDGVFGEETDGQEDTEYEKVLNINGDGMMGYLTIPKINVDLAIYHGTSDTVLQTGIGHIEGTGLPIGGENNHSVLAAHRGLPSAKLFTDIDQLEAGDEFYIHILDQTLAYKVDQILPMVDKDDHEALDRAMQIEKGKDYVTLFTCTPYGVNTHRLLVRGVRTEYHEEDVQHAPQDNIRRLLEDYYMFFLIAGIGVTIIGIGVVKLCLNRKRGRKEKIKKTK